MVNNYTNLKLLILKNCWHDNVKEFSDKINLPFISYENKVLTMGTECSYSDEYTEIKCNYSKTLPKIYKVI